MQVEKGEPAEEHPDPAASSKESAALKALNLDAYDQEDGLILFSFLLFSATEPSSTDMPVFSNELGGEEDDDAPEDAKYPFGFEESEEDKDDYNIRDTDAMIAAASIEGEFSHLEVYVFEENTSTLFVHHDIMLSSFPLCLEWLPYTPGSMGTSGPTKGNYVIVGSFLPEIEIWNLDVLNALEPEFTLGGTVQTKKSGGIKKLKQKTEYVPGSHTDAVMCLSLNSTRNYILASGSADASVKIWDLNTQKCLHTMTHHKDKVQGLKWHPVEEGVMATASFDHKLCVRDVRDSKMELTRDMKADVETITWHPHDTYLLSVASEDGTVETHDVRSFAGTPLVSFKAHDKAVSALTCSTGVKGMVVTASADQKIKVWDYTKIEGQAPKLVAEKNPGMGELYCCHFYRDSPWFIAAGGSKGELYVWDLEENASIVATFGGKTEKGPEPMETTAAEMELPKGETKSKKKAKKKPKHKSGKEGE